VSLTSPDTTHDTLQDADASHDVAEQSPGASSDVPAGSSVLAHLHQRKQEIEQAETSFELLEVPAWEGALAIRFEYPDGGSDQIINAVVKAQQVNKKGMVLDANLDLLVACCADVVGRQPGGEWERLDPTDDRPLRFGARLAGLLQMQVPDTKGNPAKWICRNVFSPKAHLEKKYVGDVQLMAIADRVVTFLQTGRSSAGETLAGE
jgi:hypothetical protein